MSERPIELEASNPESEPLSENTSPPRHSKTRRLGCAMLLLLWFALLLTPCALFYLAAKGEIRLAHRDIPQPHAHPLLLVSLVSETEDRGLRIETSRIVHTRATDGMICVETTVRFLLWQYSGGNQDAGYCDCYQREESEAAWDLVGTTRDGC